VIPDDAPTVAAPARRGRATAAAVACAAALACAFLALGAMRRLHFDEALVVRAGWLLTGHIPASPPFAMPATLAAGAAARTVADPGALFLSLRLATGALVLCGLAFAARRGTSGPAGAGAAFGLTLLTYAFVAHGVEFRYDAAILAGLLVAFGLIVRGREADFVPLGAVAAFIAAHHAKGLLFGAAILAFGALRAGGNRRRLTRLAGGAAAAAALWIGAAAALGALPDAVETVVTFGRLGATAEVRRWPWETQIARTFELDAAFWAAALLAAGSATRDLARRRPAAWREEPAVWALLFLALTLGFPFLHPMPWPYMLALPAPFAAILVAGRAPAWLEGRRRAAVLGAAAVAIAAQTFLLRAPVGAAYWASIASPRDAEVEALRTLRRLASPGERVFDPSGMAYFLPPCTREWYLDTIFQPGAIRGAWMAGVPSLSPAQCPWILFTYRIEMLPEPAKVRLVSGWERRVWGLGLRRGDPRLADLPPARPGDEITTFW
jgi:hypothetical protein